MPAYLVPGELVGEAPRALEPAAFRALVSAHAAKVWRSLRYLGVRDADLADASQEVFLVVHRRLPEFRGDSKLETWLYGICLGIARNWHRKHLRHAGEDVVQITEVVGATQEIELDQKRMRDELRWALEQIPQEQREVFVLHEIEELGMGVVARTLGCPLFTAYSRLRLARQRLRCVLEHAHGGRR